MPDAGHGKASPSSPRSHSFSFGKTGCIYMAQRTSGDFKLGLWSSAYSDPSSRNRTKGPKKSKCSVFQTYHSYLKINNNTCWFSIKETGRGKQRYAEGMYKGPAPELIKPHASCHHGTCRLWEGRCHNPSNAKPQVFGLPS